LDRACLGLRLASLVLVGWLALGPVFHWSSRWQLVASTATTLITFLMGS